MPCCLRLIGDFDPIVLASANGWKPESYWHKGDRRSNGLTFTKSGIQLGVSDAQFDDVEQQVSDALEFLHDQKQSIASAFTSGGVDEAWIDFGVMQKRLAAFSIRVPLTLISIAAELRLGIEVSLYAVDDG